MPANKTLQFARFFLRVSGWIALIPLLIGLMASVGALRLKMDLAALDRDGVEVMAVVVEKRRVAGSNGHRNSQKSSPKHYITFDFTTLDGVSVNIQGRLASAKFYASLDTGDTFPIRYLPENPTKLELYPGQLAAASIGTQVVGAVMAIFGVAMLVFFARIALKAMRARASVTKEIEAFVSHRPKWPPLLNRMGFQIGLGKTAQTHKTFQRFTPAYKGLKRKDKTRAVETEHGTYWADDLFL